MELTNEQKLALEDMISRRMEHTGEDRRTACMEVNKYFVRALNDLRSHNS